MKKYKQMKKDRDLDVESNIKLPRRQIDLP